MFKIRRTQIEELIKIELENARTYGDRYNSNHEFYGIIKEEIEEAQTCISDMTDIAEVMWQDIKDDKAASIIKARANSIKNNSILGIMELLQVCAVCDKYMEAYYESEVENEIKNKI